jgi:Ran GTPase-activating protein (RanGAP) involved in mRNA processing and transport
MEFNGYLRSLDISRNLIGIEGAKALRALLAKNETIKILNMSYNPIGWLGGVAIALGMFDNTALRSLDLSFCKLGVTTKYDFGKIKEVEKQID